MGLKTKNSGTFFNLRIRDQKYPEFQLIGKEGKEWVVKETADSYEGVFVNASIGEYEYKGDMKKKLILEFESTDGLEKETISMNFNSLALNVINTLANEEELVGKLIEMTVYSKADSAGEERPRIFIQIGGEKGSWKFDAKAMKDVFKDHDKWVSMFEKHVKTTIDNFMPESSDSSPNEDNYEKVEAGEIPEDLPDDLPF